MHSLSEATVTRPMPPFEHWPAPQLTAAGDFSWWMPKRALLVTQMARSHATMESTTALHDLIDDLLDRERAKIDEAGGMLFLHDWRSIRSFDDNVRPEFIRRMRQRPRGYQRLAVIVVTADNTAVQMAVWAGNAVAALATGRRVQIVSDPHEALTAVGLE